MSNYSFEIFNINTNMQIFIDLEFLKIKIVHSD